MSNYSQFFLNSSGSVVQLELLEISHPNFSKTYRIVRNAINGVTVTLEDASVQTFDYYPVKITPTGNSNDLDQLLQLHFGDLGDILPMELDRVVVKDTPNLNLGALLGVFTDSGGNIVGKPFLVGIGVSVYVPAGASKLYLGINDNCLIDNWGSFSVSVNGATPVVVLGSAKPWDYTAGVKNVDFPYTFLCATTASTIISTGITGLLKLTVTGTVAISGLTMPPSDQFHDGNGNPFDPTTPGDGTPGRNVVLTPPPGSVIKPTVIYRTYRSDDLSAPLNGPHRFEITNIAFQRDGSVMQVIAPRLNLSSTGEIYTMDRFPMLRGFL